MCATILAHIFFSIATLHLTHLSTMTSYNTQRIAISSTFILQKRIKASTKQERKPQKIKKNFFEIKKPQKVCKFKKKQYLCIIKKKHRGVEQW